MDTLSHFVLGFDEVWIIDRLRSVGGCLRQTASRSIVAIIAISWRDLEDRNKMKLTEEQFERECNYRLAMAIMRTLLGKGLLTEDESRRANDLLVARYNPVWGNLPDVTA